MAVTGDQLRISQIGLVARSPEGHAAKGMAIKGHEDLWVEIQANTFRNWVNEHLRSVGMDVRDLASDLCDGTRLCALVEVLQKRKLRPAWIKKPSNQHQYLENVTAALTAVSEDGVKLVNIGNVDIVNGNVKLILGLIWSLIVRYQIGRSKFPPRKLMLAWLKAVLPECRVTNFTTDWNSGIFLSALLDYCEPGLFPHWKHIDPNDSVRNCRTAMELARSQFGVPLVLEPEYLASPFLDELSGMTYLSYFMKENSPGFRATLRWVNSQLKDKHISNFTRDWNDGGVLCDLVSSLGAPARHQPSSDPQVWETNLNNGINSGRKLGVEPLLRAKDMVDSNVEHLGVMAYAAHFQWIPPRTAPSLTVAAGCDNHTTRINTQTHFKIDWLGEDVDSRNITVEVLGPELQRVDCRLSFDSAGGKGTFTPTHVGMHQITVYNEGEVVKGCPFHIRAMPEVSAITYTGMEPCAVGSIVEVLVNSNGARSGNIEVIATSPTGRERDCPVAERSGVYTATFQPDEAGEWRIAVLHSGELIQGGPFTCFVFDPNGVKLLGLDTPAVPESIFNFTMDARGTGGLGKIIIDIVQDKHSLPHTIQRFGDSMYNVSLHTGRPGKYRIYVYFNGTLVKGSPFALRVGTREQMKMERYNSSASKTSHSSPSNENHRHTSAFNRVNSPRQVSSPVDSHSPSPYGFRVNSPLGSPLRSPVEKSFSPAFRTTTSSFEKSTSSAFHINGSPIEKTSPVHRINHSPTVNGLRSPLHSPGFRSSPSPLGSPGSRSSPSFQYNTTVDTTSNVKVSSMLSSLNQRRDSWDAIHKTHNNSNDADVKVTGDALQLLPLHRASTLHIHTDAPLSQVIVTVTAPSKQQLPVKMTRSSSQQAVAYFTVTEVGEHAIDVKVKDQRVIGAPFRSHAYNSCAIKVGRIPNGTVGQPVEFEIDGSGAGSGNLEILVNGGHVTSFVRNLGNQRFLASFVPHEGLSHLVEMKFNGEVVPGSPWQVAVMSGGLGGGTPKMSVIGEAVRLVPVDQITSFQISALGFLREDVHANVISPSKRTVLSSVIAEPGGIYRVEFTPAEVGSHLVEVTVAGEKLPAGPLLAKVYNAALIRVTDVASGVVGQPCQFRVDASQAGEGQLEISINEGEVPNHVTVVGGGRCLVSFTPEHTKPHLIDIKFNGETVTGCPFVCSVSDTSRVSVSLSSLELVPVNQVARFHMAVDSSGSAELAVAVTGPSCELPVKVTGNVHSGFTAEFTPREVGPHSISVEYNGHPVSGTPFVAKAYDAKKVYVGPLPQGHVGKPLQFTVDASHAGEGNLEITISAQGVNIPTQVHPQGNAKFAVSFVPIEPVDHVISIYFNKEAVPGSLFIAPVVGDFPLVTGTSLSHAPLGVDSYFTMSNVTGSLDDIEVNVEGPNGQSVPAQVKDAGGQTFKVEFCPRVVGEHKIAVNYRQVAVAGSPFSCKVYDVNAIKVKPVQRGTVGQPVTFLVETSQAGPGNLEVTVNGGRVATSAQAQGPHTYAISFTPRQATTHTVDLRFNGRDVPGSPFSCGVAEAARVVLSGEDKVSVDKPATFVVECEPSVEQPQVQVLSPSRHPVPVNVKPTDISGRYACTLTTKDVGDHSVEVKLAGGHVEGSPFLIKAYDATKVKVTDINSGTVGKPVYFSINASQAGAGNLEIIVSVNGCNVPNYVQSEGNAKFRVNFKPREAAPHSLSVRFNGEPIPGSPFTCRVLEPGQVSVSGSGVRMTSASRPALVHIDGASTCEVTVTSPSNRKLPVKVDRSDNRYTAEFTPVEVGRHLVAVDADGQTVKGSPFACNVYNVNNIKVTGLGPAKVGKPVTFSVDAMEAGEGTLELVISTQQSTVKAEVVACSRGLYDVTFVPHQLAPHFVNITFNEEDVPGSPYRCEVVQLPSKKATATARGEGLNQVVLGTAAYFEINPHSSDHGSLDAQVIGPDGSRVPCTIEKLETGLYRAKYRPVIVGTHSVTVTQRKQPITKQPFTVQVFDPLQVKLTDLSEAFCHRAATFKVDTRGAGSGALSVSIRAAGGEVKHTLRELETPGLYQVVYHPQLAIPHKIHIKYNSMNIAGCPMEVAVTDPAVGRDVCATGLGLYQSRAGRVTHFTIETAGRPAHEFDVVITGPQGSAVPVRCYQQKDGNLMAEFTANNTGVYKIDVLQGSRPVRGSPYHCQVFDATKVKIEALAANSVSVNENISFKLVRKNAGFAELDVTVRSPLGQDLPLSVRSIGEETDLIELCPSLPGNYCFHITYGGDSIPDSPLTFTVVESGVARAWGQGLSRALLDTQASFHVACNGVNSPAKPDVTMDGPEHTSVKCVVTKAQNSGEYEVTYTPNRVGVYDIRISCNGKPIAGSPFRAYVVCVERVRLLNDIPGGRLPLSVHMPTRLTFDVSQAGPGDLAVECKAPHNSTLPVPVDIPSPDRVQLIVTPRTPGPHTLHLSYGGFLLPCSPVQAMAEGGAGGVRVVLTGKGLAGAVCNQQAEFTIDGSQAGPGMPEVSLSGMKNDIKVNLQPIGENVYRATYIPTQPGAYLLNVMWSDRQVKGCPLKVTVTAVCDASRVICSGDGLGTGIVGKDIRSFIDTRAAGPGELSAHCVGPHKVAYCELYDHSDGTFTLNVKPQEAGRHTLTVKYGGVDVPGSPFCLKVSGAPDASKVRVYGPGVEHGVLATFQSRFICDTRGAGAGQLTVRVRGPKGAFRVEMQRESQKDRTILCKFDPTEPGDYRVEIKWAGEHVPGSPFMVMIFDTQEELNRFLSGSQSPGSEVYGSVAYSTGYAHITP